MKHIFIFFGLLGGAIFFFGPKGYLAQTTPASPSDSVLYLKGANGSVGTGFVVSYAGKSFTVTNAHVCGNNVSMSSRKGVSALPWTLAVVGLHPSVDLCILQPDRTVSPLILAAQDPSPGENLTVIGHPLGGPRVIEKGITLFQKVIKVVMMRAPPYVCEANGLKSLLGIACVYVNTQTASTVVVRPGSSGSPVLNTENDVVGVINAGSIHRDNWGVFIQLDDLIGALEATTNSETYFKRPVSLPTSSNSKYNFVPLHIKEFFE